PLVSGNARQVGRREERGVSKGDVTQFKLCVALRQGAGFGTTAFDDAFSTGVGSPAAPGFEVTLVLQRVLRLAQRIRQGTWHRGLGTGLQGDQPQQQQGWSHDSSSSSSCRLTGAPSSKAGSVRAGVVNAGRAGNCRAPARPT